MTITRRQALEAGAALGVAAAFGAGSAFAQIGALIQKRIPKSGEMLPPIGIGTNRYGVGTSEEERAPLRDTMARFVELGGKVMDTAMVYGTSEAVIGDLAQGLGIRDRLFFATKTDIRGQNARRGRLAASVDAHEDRHDRRDARAQPRQRRDRAARHARVAAAREVSLHRRLDLDAQSVRADGAVHARTTTSRSCSSTTRSAIGSRRNGYCRRPRTAASRS